MGAIITLPGLQHRYSPDRGEYDDAYVVTPLVLVRIVEGMSSRVVDVPSRHFCVTLRSTSQILRLAGRNIRF